MYKSAKKTLGRLNRNVEVGGEFDLDSSQLWNLVENVDNYPKYIKFVMYAKLDGSFEAGSKWVDLSTIIIFPIPVIHEILEVVDLEKAVYLIKFPFGGSIIQTVSIKSNTKGAEFKISNVINMGNKFADLLLGKFIEKRTREMLEDSLVKFSRNLH